MFSRITSRNSALRLVVLMGLALAPVALVVPGCGGGSGNSSSRILSRATGTVSLNNGQTGTLNFRILNTGQGLGTFTIANTAVPSNVQATQTTFRVGEYTVGGFYNESDNTITLSGTISGVGLVTIPVNLPNSESTGSFTVTIQGQTFGPGTFSSFSTPTPRPTVTATAAP